MSALEANVDAVSYYMQRCGATPDSFIVFQEVFIPLHKIAFHFDSNGKVQVIRTEIARHDKMPQSHWKPPPLNPKLKEIKITSAQVEACYLYLNAQKQIRQLGSLLSENRWRSEFSDSAPFL